MPGSLNGEPTSPHTVPGSPSEEREDALGLSRRRSSAYSFHGRPATAPPTKLTFGGEAGLDNATSTLGVTGLTASPRSTRSTQLPASQLTPSNSTTALPVPSPRDRAKSIDRPSTAPVERPSTAPAMDASSRPVSRRGKEPIMIDGQAFVLDEEDDGVGPLRPLKQTPAPAPVRTAPRAVDLSEMSKAAEVAEHRRTASSGSSQSQKPVYQWHMRNGGLDRRPGTAPQPTTPTTSPLRRTQDLASTPRSTVRSSKRPGTATSTIASIASRSTRALGIKGSQSLDLGSKSKGSKEADDDDDDDEEAESAGGYAISQPSKTALQEVSEILIYDEEGDKVRFGDLFSQQRTLVCFLRHWFCPMCQEYATSMKQIDPLPLQRAGLGFIVVGQGHPHVIASYKRVMGVPEWIKMYSDPSRKTYQALGMTLKTNDPGPACAKPDYITMPMFKSSMTAIKKSLFEMPIRSPGDLKLLGGEFILGPGIDCSFVHRMTTTRGHLDIPRILAQAGCDMTLKSPKAIGSEDSARPESVKSLGARRGGKRSASGLRSVRSIARNFEAQRRVSSARVDGAKTTTLSSPPRKLHAAVLGSIPAVPKIPAAQLFEARSFAKPIPSPRTSPRKAPKRLSSDFRASTATNKVRSTPPATPRSEAKRLSEERLVEEDLRRWQRENEAGSSGRANATARPSTATSITSTATARQRSGSATLDVPSRPGTGSSSRPSSSESSRSAAVFSRGPQNTDVPLLRPKRSWLSAPLMKKAASTSDLNAELQQHQERPASSSSARPPSASSSTRGSLLRGLTSIPMRGSRTSSNDRLPKSVTMAAPSSASFGGSSSSTSTPRQSTDVQSLHSLRSVIDNGRSPVLAQGPSSSSSSSHSRNSIPLNVFERRIIGGGAGAAGLFGGVTSSASSTKTTTPPATPRLSQQGGSDVASLTSAVEETEYSAPRLHERQQQQQQRRLSSEPDDEAADQDVKSRRAAAHLSRISERPERISTFTAAESDATSPPLPPLPALPQEHTHQQREDPARPSTDSRLTTSSVATSEGGSSEGSSSSGSDGSSTPSRGGGSPHTHDGAPATGFGGGSFLADLDVVYDGFARNGAAGGDAIKGSSSRDTVHAPASARAVPANGAGNRDTFYSEDYEGYRTSLDSWRSSSTVGSDEDDDEDAADEDSEELEHEPGWTRPNSVIATSSSTNGNGSGAGVRLSNTVVGGKPGNHHHNGHHSHSRQDSTTTMGSSTSSTSTEYRSSTSSGGYRVDGSRAVNRDSVDGRPSYDSRAETEDWTDDEDGRPRVSYSTDDEEYSSGSSGVVRRRDSYDEERRSSSTAPTTTNGSFFPSAREKASPSPLNGSSLVARRALATPSPVNGSGTASPTPSMASHHAAHRFGQKDAIREEEEEEGEDALETPKVATRELPAWA